MGKELKNGDYILIQADFLTELALKGNDLLVYSIIYGFSKDGNSRYTGSLDYLAKWTNSSARSVTRNLANLVERDLIIKYEYNRNGVKFCEYAANLDANVYGIDKMSGGYRQNVYGGIDKMSNNNIVYNTINNLDKKENNIKEKRFTKPTIEELKEYCSEKKLNVDCEKFFNYYESKGWVVGKAPMKSWKAALANWSKNTFGNTSTKQELPSWYGQYQENSKNNEEVLEVGDYSFLD